MLSEDVARWETTHPWKQTFEIEQDMWLERLMVAVSQNPDLKDTIALSGGTGLNKLWLPKAMRYSEDLDYVCLDGSPQATLEPLLQTALDIGLQAFNPRPIRRKPPFPKVMVGFMASAPKLMRRVKVELAKLSTDINLTHQFEYVSRSYPSESWLPDEAQILAMKPTFMAAMKIQALFSRSKGRDLFDFYHLVKTLGVSPRDVIGLVEYAKLNEPRVKRWTAKTAAVAMREHMQTDSKFMADIEAVVPGWAETPQFEEAIAVHAEFAAAVHQEVSRRVKARKAFRRLGRPMPASTAMTPDLIAIAEQSSSRVKHDPDRAKTLKRLGMTNAQIARMMGVSESWAQRQTRGMHRGQLSMQTTRQ